VVLDASAFYIHFAAYAATLGMQASAVGSVRGYFLESQADYGPLIGRLSGQWRREQISNNFAGLESARHARHPFAPRQWYVVAWVTNSRQGRTRVRT